MSPTTITSTQEIVPVNNDIASLMNNLEELVRRTDINCIYKSDLAISCRFLLKIRFRGNIDPTDLKEIQKLCEYICEGYNPYMSKCVNNCIEYYVERIIRNNP